MIHLDPQRLSAILDGSMPERERRALMGHLAGSCEICDAALADGPDLDTLLRLFEAEEAAAQAPASDEADGMAAALFGPGGLLDQARDAVEQQTAAEPVAERRGSTDPQGEPEPSPPPDNVVPLPLWGRRRWQVAAAVVALAAVILVVARVSTTSPYEPLGIKGSGMVAPTVELSLAAGELILGQTVTAERVVDGDTLTASSAVFFSLQVDRPCARYVFAIDGADTVHHIYPPDPGDGEPLLPPVEGAESTGLAWGGQIVVFKLSDVVGPVTLVGAASTDPLDVDTQVIGPWRRGTPSTAVGFDTARLEITP